ncbi:hypothetical protein ACFVZN_04025 [Streptomyces virginiae]|uniref:hypothetical protein n=1 Tax=Streptomyces virginiae TaxID=1961 RepID=UPI0036A3B8AC
MSATVRWVTGAPLWAAAAGKPGGGRPDAMLRPELLRFASDSFMDDLAALLMRRPAELADHLARPVGFRNRPPGAPADWPPPLDVLKLYQPLHGDFNLVVASLVCGLTGLPDHRVRTEDGERLCFVLRRSDRAAGESGGERELAWASDPGAPGTRSWLPVAPEARGSLAAGEELFPMFPVNYAADGGQRRLYAGLVPVSSRETFRAARSVEPAPAPLAPPSQEPDARWTEFDSAVLGPLTELRRPDPQHSLDERLLTEATAFLMLDFADLLQRHLPRLWDALRTRTRPSRAAEARLYDDLLGGMADRVAGLTWRDGLVAAAVQWASIAGEPGSRPHQPHGNARHSTTDVSTLRQSIRDALPPPQPAGTPGDLQLTKIDPTGETDYLIRCVYLKPRCGPARTDLLSAPTRRFRIASVFDPDAPARTIRIPMPVNTGIKDLRKYRKGVGFVLSNQLRGQMDRLTDLKKALDGDIADQEEIDLGVICQFSIPIITICALMVLIVFVFLLDIVFFWKWFFRICLPVPVRSKR